MPKSTLRVLGITFSLLCAVLCLAFVAMGQSETGAVSGLVTDSTGAAAAGVEVQLKSVDEGTVSTTKTNGSGLYVFASVKPGKYQIKVQKSGFKQVDFLNLIVNVQDHIEQNFRLELGSISETVTVTGGAGLMNVENGTVATTIDRTFMENLPLNGRSFQSLIFLAPGVTVVPPATLNTNGEFSVNGQRSDANGFTVDGVDANFASGGGTNQANTTGNIPAFTIIGTTQSLASVDAVQEFKIQTSSYAAEFGPHPGGQVSIVTRSGTNQYHGSAFDYFRNTDLDSNTWFVDRAATTPGVFARRAPEHQNDFGGVLGGPIRIPHVYDGHDRTFFFFSYEGLRLLLPTSATTGVPGLCLRGTSAAECTALNAANSVAPAISPLPTFTTPPAAFLPLFNSFPLPTAGSVIPVTRPALGYNGFGTVFAAYSNPGTIDTTAIRIDHTINSRVTIFGRYQNSPSSSTSRSTSNLSYEGTTTLHTWTLTGGATILITPSTSNDLRVNFSSNGTSSVSSQTTFGGAVPITLAQIVPASLLGTPVGASVLFNFPGGLSPFPAVSNVGVPLSNNNREFNLVDSLSHTMGSHQLKFGGTFRRILPTEKNAPFTISADFQATATGFNTVAAALQQIYASQINNFGGNGTPCGGTVAAGSVAVCNPSGVVLVETGSAFPLTHNYSFFAEDTWKVTHRLTLDYGVRWDITPPPTNSNGNPAMVVNQITNLSTATLAFSNQEYKTDWHAFSPRLGVAYQLRTSPGWETVLRGGFGTFFDTGNAFTTGDFQKYPYAAQIVGGNTVEPLNFPFVLGTGVGQLNVPTIPAALTLPLPAGTTLPTLASGYVFFDPNLSLPLTLEYNVALQQALGRSQTLTVTYVGASGRNLWLTTNLANSVIKNPQFLSSSSFGLVTNGTSSNYNALQAQFNRRLTRGFQMLVGYTWSHSLDTDSANRDVPAVSPTYGNSSFDIRQIVTVATTYDIPAPSHSALVRTVLGGWAVDNTFHAQTAPPVDVVSTTITDATGNTINIRPDVVPGIPLYSSGNCTPPAGAPGNTLCPGDRQLNFAANAFTVAQGIAAGCATTTNPNTGVTTINLAKGPFCTPAVVGGVQQNGNLGRNYLRALGAWQVDMAVQRQFKITERVNLTFRAEAFNVLNHPNFAPPNTSLSSASFGQATTTLASNLSQNSAFALYALGGPRSGQLSLKLRF